MELALPFNKQLKWYRYLCGIYTAGTNTANTSILRQPRIVKVRVWSFRWGLQIAPWSWNHSLRAQGGPLEPRRGAVLNGPQQPANLKQASPFHPPIHSGPLSLYSSWIPDWAGRPEISPLSLQMSRRGFRLWYGRNEVLDSQSKLNSHLGAWSTLSSRKRQVRSVFSDDPWDSPSHSQASKGCFRLSCAQEVKCCLVRNPQKYSSDLHPWQWTVRDLSNAEEEWSSPTKHYSQAWSMKTLPWHRNLFHCWPVFSLPLNFQAVLGHKKMAYHTITLSLESFWSGHGDSWTCVVRSISWSALEHTCRLGVSHLMRRT